MSAKTQARAPRAPQAESPALVTPQATSPTPPTGAVTIGASPAGKVTMLEPGVTEAISTTVVDGVKFSDSILARAQVKTVATLVHAAAKSIAAQKSARVKGAHTVHVKQADGTFKAETFDYTGDARVIPAIGLVVTLEGKPASTRPASASALHDHEFVVPMSNLRDLVIAAARHDLADEQAKAKEWLTLQADVKALASFVDPDDEQATDEPSEDEQLAAMIAADEQENAPAE